MTDTPADTPAKAAPGAKADPEAKANADVPKSHDHQGMYYMLRLIACGDPNNTPVDAGPAEDELEIVRALLPPHVHTTQAYLHPSEPGYTEAVAQTFLKMGRGRLQHVLKVESLFISSWYDQKKKRHNHDVLGLVDDDTAAWMKTYRDAMAAALGRKWGDQESDVDVPFHVTLHEGHFDTAAEAQAHAQERWTPALPLTFCIDDVVSDY